HVQDAADALVALLDSDLQGAVNVGSGNAVSVRSLVRRLGVLTGRPELVRCGAVPDRPDEPPLIVADVGRLRGELGWSPRFTLEGGLAQTVDWWRNQSRVQRLAA